MRRSFALHSSASRPGVLFLCLLLIVTGWPGADTSVKAQETWTQEQIDRELAGITETYGITFAFPGEWQAQHADELPLLTAYVQTMQDGLAMTADTLWQLDGSPPDYSPEAYFRLHFDQAYIRIDRVMFIPGGYGGNTQPIYENGRTIAYLIQLAPQGIGQPYTLAHEIGHVLDGLLTDTPQNQHREFLGGEWTPAYWIPDNGYDEQRFPRAQAGPNEDFADTFGQMMAGNLSPFDVTAPRWLFMSAHTHHWLAVLRGRRAIHHLVTAPEDF